MKQLLLMLLWGLASVGAAQPTVYHVSGEIYRQARPWPQRLHVGETVQPGQVLELKPSCQVIFITPQGKTLAYSQAGHLSYSTLQQAFSAVPPSPTQQYVAYVCRKLTEKSVPADQQGNVPVGGVSRGEQLLLWAPTDSAVVEQPEVTFQWVAGAAPFRFTITDTAGNPLLQLTTPASVLGLNLALTGLKRNVLYYWSVAEIAGGAGNAPRQSFLWPDEALQSQLQAQLPATPALSAAEQQWRAQFGARWLYGHLTH